MTERSVTHAIFTIERTYDASPAHVFKAWSTIEAKSRWFVGPDDWKTLERAMDFRVGGRERVVGQFGAGRVSTFDCHYHDIVPDRRIVYSYDMKINDQRISVSLATVEFTPAGAGTRLLVTEHGAFLDGYDDAGSRERGTMELLDKMGKSLAS